MYVFVSPEGTLKVAGYEKFLASDEAEAFLAGAGKYLQDAKTNLANGRYEEAFNHVTQASSALLYGGIYGKVASYLTMAREGLASGKFKLVKIDEKHLALELAETDIKTVFRINTNQGDKELIQEMNRQLQSRLASLSNKGTELKTLVQQRDAFTAEFYPILKKWREKNAKNP